MNTEEFKRKLTAILSADVEGYRSPTPIHHRVANES
jgi:hypothetical protein